MTVPQPVHWNPRRPGPRVLAFLRAPATDPEAERAAAAILADVREEGDAAVARHALALDGTRLVPGRFRLRDLSAAPPVSPSFDRAARRALRAIERFARAGLRKDWEIPLPGGGRAGERYLPLERVGLYVPGGAAPLASTVLMTAVLARVAGVPEIVACTPAGADGRVDPHLLHALRLAGVTEAYRVGGVQAIGAMAYGTRTIRRVDKIVGPGGPYVTAAKRLVYGQVALDLVAGPSEIAVLADDTGNPRWIAEDLLSQAEHGTGRERVLLAATDRDLAAAVRRELLDRARGHPRREAVQSVLRSRALLAVCRSAGEAMELVNRFAPEHLEIHTRNARRRARDARRAGALFLGPWTPESAGDFAAGPSHVLPTGGTARFFSGLSVEDFRRRTSVIELTRGGLRALRPTIEAFSEAEGLPSHGRSAALRFEP